MFRIDSFFFNLAASFTGKYRPFQGVTLTPHAGGVVISSSDRGAALFYGFDPSGTASRVATFLPGKELAAACKGIKTAQRELTIDGDQAIVTTYYKEHNTSKEFRVACQDETPSLAPVLQGVIDLWGETPTTSTTAGRYDLALLHKATRAILEESDCLVLSGYDGGPLRLQSSALRCVVLLMPQTAVPLPGLPPWLADFSRSC